MNAPESVQAKQAGKQPFDLAAACDDTLAMRYFPFSADQPAAGLQARPGEKILDVEVLYAFAKRPT